MQLCLFVVVPLVYFHRSSLICCSDFYTTCSYSSAVQAVHCIYACRALLKSISILPMQYKKESFIILVAVAVYNSGLNTDTLNKGHNSYMYPYPCVCDPYIEDSGDTSAPLTSLL